MQTKRVHFTGIKGVGMAALALAAQDRGWVVDGSDTKERFITDEILTHRRINVYDSFSPHILDNNIDLLVHTAAHRGADNDEVKWAVSRQIPVMNYARALGNFFSYKDQVCICGVGGKTTTTAMLATILYHADLDPSWIIGTSEISSLPAPGRYGKGAWALIEGDEYVADPVADKTPKFMYLDPKIVVCTNIHHDHPDVYPTEADTVKAYTQLFRKLPKDGLLLLSSQAYAAIAKQNRFDNLEIYDTDEELKRSVRKVLKVPGEYNVQNAMAAVKVSEHIGIPRQSALRALATYTGSKRRFEHIGTVDGVSLYDDYAHHPDEIARLLTAVREKFPSPVKIRFIFQPHTYSRTKALFAEFAHSLTGVDETIMYPIFASARERIDPSISSQLLAREINRLGGRAIYVPTIEKLVQYLCQSAKSPEVIFTVGAGNLYELHHQLVKGLRER